MREPDSSTDAEGEGPSCELLALVEAHQAACSYPAVSEGDRLAKAEYLLKIEARGELDLNEHMQAVLRSTMWRALG